MSEESQLNLGETALLTIFKFLKIFLKNKIILL